MVSILCIRIIQVCIASLSSLVSSHACVLFMHYAMGHTEKRMHGLPLNLESI